jgi:hypothetical protein
MSGVTDLIAALRDPATLTALDGPRWTALMSVAKTEVLLGTLAAKADGLNLPPAIAALFAAQREATAAAHVKALWEAERAKTALAPLGITPILLKGTAYVAAGLSAGEGRQIGDLDILIPRNRLDEAEAALLDAGWQWLKPDPYDDAYYRRWMHELPPLIHREREAMIDVHHSILPLTHRARPDAAAMLADVVTLESGLQILSPNDMIIHCAAHVLADGDLAGGLRNLWDFHCLTREIGPERLEEIHAYDTAAHGIDARAERHQLVRAVGRAYRLAWRLFGSDAARRVGPAPTDRLFLRRLTARDDWGRESRPATRLAFYLRSHWLRMPPLMLAQHLWTKWRRH